MRLNGLDLNLLVALDVLLEERSVSRSAERLHLSQPAVSAALGRLRNFFDDELLVQHGKRMIPTAHAEFLMPAVKRILSQADALTSMSTEFDAARSEREFRIITSDYIAIVVLAPLLARLEKIAPGIKLDLLPATDRVSDVFEQGEIELSIAPEQWLSPKHPAELLFEETYVVVGWSENPIFAEPLTKSVFLDQPQIEVTFGTTLALTYAGIQFKELGVTRRIEGYAPSYSALPWLLVGTSRVAVMQTRLAQVLVPTMPLKIAPLPIPIPPMREMLQFHAARENDQGLEWLRNELREVARVSETPKK